MIKAAVSTKPASLPRRRSLRNAAELAAAGFVPPEKVAELEHVARRYAVSITPAVLDLIDPADGGDPIARQYIPDARELETAPEERSDPIGDRAHAPVRGIVHRYPDRALLTPILHCPVYCRFCFRREIVGGEKAVLSDTELKAALDYLRQHTEIWEVVITGGDPFMLSPKRLEALVRTLDAIPHLAVIRFHTRVPVSDPERVSPALVAALAADKAVWVAIHCNHPRELSPTAEVACHRLIAAGIPLLGQTVLLKGINDNPRVMEALMRALVRNRIKPYYLHHLDLAPGTNQFRATLAEGKAIMRELRGRVSGVCQPLYVLDIPGGFGKVPVGPCYLGEDGTVEDWRGQRHAYPPRSRSPAAVAYGRSS